MVYEGFGHNLPVDVVRHHAEHWFRLYMHPTHSSPAPVPEPVSLQESVRKTQINATAQQEATGVR